MKAKLVAVLLFKCSAVLLFILAHGSHGSDAGQYMDQIRKINLKAELVAVLLFKCSAVLLFLSPFHHPLIGLLRPQLLVEE